MIMPPGQQLLLPASPVFIWATLFIALVLNMAPSASGLGSVLWLPDPLALVLVFWSVHQPRRVGVGVSFAFGLLVDVHQTALLGQHALCYTVLSYWAVVLHRRLPWFSPLAQALHIAPLFVTAQVLEIVLRLSTGDAFAGWLGLIAPVLEALLWPLVSALLLMPQRRPPDPDKHRPL